MGDINDQTQNVSIYPEGSTSPITSTTDGAKERLDVQVAGTVSIEAPSDSIPLQVRYNKAFSAVNANEWQEIAEYTVPNGYHYSVVSFRSFSETAGERARVFVEKLGGSFVCSTNTFTDGIAYTTPQFGSGVYIEVTTQIGSGSDDVITITYVNELGVGGRTAQVTLTKGSLVGTHLEFTLQGNDIGITDITNVTHSATGQAGAFNVEMYYEVFNLLMPSAGIQYQAVSISGNPVIIDSNEKILLGILAGTKTSYIRNLSLFGTLVVVP